MNGGRLTKHERYLLSLVEAAKTDYRSHDKFVSWLRGFNRPATMRPVLRDLVRKYIKPE